jgi:hypothetical protein
MRHIFPRYDYLLGQMRRLDDISRRMNPFLALVIVALLILNFTRALNLIDWRN